MRDLRTSKSCDLRSTIQSPSRPLAHCATCDGGAAANHVRPSQLQAPQTMIGAIEKRLVVQHRANEASKRLESIPGIGILGASHHCRDRHRPEVIHPVVILPSGLSCYPDKIQPGANRSSDRSPNRATATCGVFL